MAEEHRFEHLPLVLRDKGPARLQRPQISPDPITDANRRNRVGHSASLGNATAAVVANWAANQKPREDVGAPHISAGIPLLLRIDPTLDLDEIRNALGLEIIAEQEDGFRRRRVKRHVVKEVSPKNSRL